MTTLTASNQIMKDDSRLRLPTCVALFVILMAGTVAVRLIEPIGWLGSDDASYHAAAEHLVNNHAYERVHHHFARTPVVAAVAASMCLFGETPFTLAFPMLVAAVLCVALVALIGRLLWGWVEGLLAAVILSFNPMFVNGSTSVLPDVHACLWVAVAFLLALFSIRSDRLRPKLWLAVACGLAIGLATSAKLFGALTLIGVLPMAWLSGGATASTGNNGRHRFMWVACLLCGCVLFSLAEGVFFAWMANDFWYKLHAIHATKSGVETGPLVSLESLSGLARLVWYRVAMPFRVLDSHWGVIGMAFWPATILVLFRNRTGRAVAMMAIGTFLFAALVPISLDNGWRLFPWLNGRNIGVVCVPFALCLAWMIGRAASALVPHRLYPAFILAAMLTIGAVSTRDRSTLNTTLAFHQQQVGLAVQQIVEQAEWDDHSKIFMPPSLYWRYRILFPSHLRDRLRVAADENAPTWWREMTVDITERWEPLPQPEDAYLLVTPEQLQGECHVWDYGVGLPREHLDRWQRAIKVVTVTNTEHQDTRSTGSANNAPPLLMLIHDADQHHAKLFPKVHSRPAPPPTSDQ